MLNVNLQPSTQVPGGRKLARLMIWDAMLHNPDPAKRRLLARIYNRLSEK